MIFSGVKLPDQLRIALEEGRLVVFAGAGISIPEPSGLPSFNDLVRRIAGISKDAKIENPEKILGALARKDIKVHTAAAGIVYHPGTRPTDLHRELLRLFGEAGKVRIVTTNFDNHFTDAAKEVLPDWAVGEYHAPALPLGDDFEGIVYLHGAARLDPKRLVLTDEDFGKAYLTRGWARDFLMALFAKYTVMFVGYSHSDITVSYIARGMSPAEMRPRWAYVPADIDAKAQDDWTHLGVETAQYPVDRASTDNQHQALTDFSKRWADHQQASIIDHSVKVRAIAANLPPEGDAEAEYVLYCLGHAQVAQDFCNAITHPAWFGWMEKRELFSPFFASNQSGPKSDFTTTQRIIGWWVCSFIRLQHPQLLLELIQRNQGRLSLPFADILGHQLWTKDGKPTDPLFGTWAALLLARGEHALPQSSWAYILQKCEIPAHTAVALRIFELLTTPQLHLERGWAFELGELIDDDEPEKKKKPKRKADYTLHWPPESDHWLEQAWNMVFRPSLAALSEPLVTLVTKQLTMGHLLLRDSGKASDEYDSLSWSISSIAPHEQNRHPLHKCVSILVNIARELLDHWMTSDRPRALAQIEAWWRSGVPLLHRLGIYGVAIDPSRPADEKLDWLLSNDLIFAWGRKKEVFDALAMAYPKASASMRRKVVAHIERGLQGKRAEKLQPDTIAYESFNALQWLKTADPQCAIVERAIRKMQKAHPTFGVREYLEFEHWHGEAGFIDQKKGFDFDKIVAEPPERYLDALFNAKEASFRHDRWSYLGNLKVLFEKDRAWAKGFMVAAARREEADQVIWNGIFSAWREILKTQQDWQWILDRIEDLPKRSPVFSGVAYILSHGFWKDETKATAPMIARALRANLAAWELCKDDPEKPDDTHQDWYTDAINHTGGWIAEFWVHYCNEQRKRTKKKSSRLARKIRTAIIEALDGDNKVRVYGRLALTPFVVYLFVWDKALGRDKFLPLFDWKRDPIVAQQSWSVFLNYRRATNLDWEKQLLPYYRQVVRELPAFLKQTAERREQFDRHALRSLGGHLAALAMRTVDNPVTSGFFKEFLPLLPDEIRASLARGIGDFIEKMTAAEQKKVWDTWLRDYLDKRLLGIPVSLGHEESREIADWCLDLGDLFPAAVTLVSKMPLKKVFVHGLIDKLLSSPLLGKYPETACEFMVVAMRADDFRHLHGDFPKLHAKLKELIPRSPHLRVLETQMYELGWKPETDGTA